MLFERSKQYNPTEREKKNCLRYDYSLTHGKIIEEYKGLFVRVNDYPYSRIKGTDIKVREHYLILPKLGKSNIPVNERTNLYLLRKKRSDKGYTIILNSKQNKSVSGFYHEHIIKLLD